MQADKETNFQGVFWILLPTCGLWTVRAGRSELTGGAGNAKVKSGLTPLMLRWFNVKMKIV